MRTFDVPEHYRSPLITAIKAQRKADDRLKKDFQPTTLQIGSITLLLARHFGFCYGVENAIEIAFRAVAENRGKRIFLLSEMIHNPGVNADLQALGIQFIMDTKGRMLMDWNDIEGDDIVIIPAFGTTLETEQLLRTKGIDPQVYETTCPFVEKVWNRAGKIGDDGYTIVVHGKPGHEETRATFSHSRAHTPTVVVKDLEQARVLAQYITQSLPTDRFYSDFQGQYSDGFDPALHLQRIGVVNQTTMLASETQMIADFLRSAILEHYQTPPHLASERVADTRDTLCYATNDNQSAVQEMLMQSADIAIVIGGYNSSNTTHLVELCEQVLPVYFIENEHCILSAQQIRHYDIHHHAERITTDYLTSAAPRIMITSGASCPDALVERVIAKVASLTGHAAALQQVISEWVVPVV
jgi:4-hydroxy-3-methylbut-2-enyl diphosphate reductase